MNFDGLVLADLESLRYDAHTMRSRLSDDAAFARQCLCYGAMYPMSAEGRHGMEYDEYLRGEFDPPAEDPVDEWDRLKHERGFLR